MRKNADQKNSENGHFLRLVTDQKIQKALTVSLREKCL